MIKKLVVLAFIMFISIIAAEMTFCQSQIYSGDKSLRENKRTIRMIRKQIAKYDKIDSPVIDYYQKVDFLENQLNDLIAVTAGKDARQRMNLKSRDPRKAAEAYLLVKYADNFKSDQSVSARQTIETDSGKLKGIVVNNWYQEVIAQVTGPANFFREFNIKPNGKSPEFTLPIIGDYTTVFIYGSERRAVSKKVGPNIVYYENTTAYDYKATLPRHSSN